MKSSDNTLQILLDPLEQWYPILNDPHILAVVIGTFRATICANYNLNRDIVSWGCQVIFPNTFIMNFTVDVPDPKRAMNECMLEWQKYANAESDPDLHDLYTSQVCRLVLANMWYDPDRKLVVPMQYGESVTTN